MKEPDVIAETTSDIWIRWNDVWYIQFKSMLDNPWYLARNPLKKFSLAPNGYVQQRDLKPLPEEWILKLVELKLLGKLGED